MTAFELPEEEDEALVARGQRGDHDAFGKLYTRHYSYSWGVAYRMVFHRNDADDLAQTAWVKVYKGLHTFKPDARFLPWLHQITVHVGIDHCRRQRRRPEVPAADVEALSAPTPMIARSSVADAVANEDVVRRALLALTPPHYRVVLVLADMLDMSSAHIAEILEMRASQVDPILNRARKKFAALVTRELDDQIGGE